MICPECDTCPECNTAHDATKCVTSLPRFLLATTEDHRGLRGAIYDRKNHQLAPFGGNVKAAKNRLRTITPSNDLFWLTLGDDLLEEYWAGFIWEDVELS